MKILAVDIGMHTGIAYNLRNEQDITAATYDLATPREISEWGRCRLTRRCDPRCSRFAEILRRVTKGTQPDVVVFEDVEFSTYTLQTQLWSALRTTLWLTLGDSGAHLDCVPVSSLKRFATGHGGATKKMMKAALLRKHPEISADKLDDNAIDAIWIFLWAGQTLRRIPR